jgi:hypothetical protein
LLPTTQYHKSHWPWTPNSTVIYLIPQSSRQFFMICWSSRYIIRFLWLKFGSLPWVWTSLPKRKAHL